jgi:hypothetical protein
MSRFFIRWSSVALVSVLSREIGQAAHTLNFRDVHAELVSLLEHSLPAFFDKLVEALSELIHPTPQVVEAEVYGRKLISHAGRIVQGGAHHARGERRFECCHCAQAYSGYYIGDICDRS